MKLEILDGEILLDGRVVARVIAGLPYAVESELTDAIDECSEEAREEFVRDARQDVLSDIVRAEALGETLEELEEARTFYAQWNAKRTEASLTT